MIFAALGFAGSQSLLAQIIESAQLPAQFQTAFINAVRHGTRLDHDVYAAQSDDCQRFSSILSFLICFLGCYIVATFIIHLICYVFAELPVLRHLDALAGGVVRT